MSRELDQCCEGRLQHTAMCPLLPPWGPTDLVARPASEVDQ